jgi:hypothetical protein
MVRRLIARLSSSDEHGALLVRRSLAYIEAGKNGLAEDELLAVLSADLRVMYEFRDRHPDSPSVDALPFLIWARLHDELRPYLRQLNVDDTQTLDFFHAQFKDVVAEDFLDASERAARHEALACYFADLHRIGGAGGESRPHRRALSELPFQWAQAGRWADLDSLLLDFHFLQNKLTAFGPQPLIEDFALALTVPGRSGQTTAALAMLRDTFVLAADVLRVNPAQLAPQLHARLAQSGDPLLDALLAAARPPGVEW